MQQFDEQAKEWRRLFAHGTWVARARRDEERDTWIISAVDHSGLMISDEAPGELSPEEALDRAQALSPWS